MPERLLLRRVGLALVAASAAAALLAACGSDGNGDTGQGEEFREAELTPLLIQRGPDIVPVEGSDGRYHLLWEVPVENATSLPLTVTEIEVTSGAEPVLSLGPDEVADVVEVLGTRTADPDLGPADGATIFLTAAFDDLADVPAEITHSVTIEADSLPEPITATGGEVTVDADAVVPVLGPPIESGAGYVAADGCCASTRHIRAGLPVDNQLWFIQRFAIDWEQINDNDQFVVGDPSNPENYVVYGKQAIAAADGTVVNVLDGLDDQTPGELPGTAIPLREADGNTVTIDIGDGLYMSYAHLQKGSIVVAVGDQVSRGDPVARVGNTGNSSAPHLHFHVADGPTNFAANGRPYVIDTFEVTARGRSTEDFDEVENTQRPFPLVNPPGGAGPRTDELPLDQSIVTFS